MTTTDDDLRKLIRGERTWTIAAGDCREVMRRLPAGSVQMCMTSPPYYGLRDYGIPPSIWGGRVECAHAWIEETYRLEDHGDDGSNTNLEGSSTHGQTRLGEIKTATCTTCGAWRGWLGLERTPELYVEHMREVFREVFRVLRPDGTLWLNLGDSYARAGGVGDGENRGLAHLDGVQRRMCKVPEGYKEKDLLGIPWTIALALRADGWHLRSEIIWHKTNPMPERVTDRPTRSHEHVFLLTRSPMYFYDAEAIKEPVTGTAKPRGKGVNKKSRDVELKAAGDPNRIRANNDFLAAVNGLVETRNKRSVWTIATEGVKEAHFATYPTELVEPCVKAGTSERGACPSCGTPWDRIVQRTRTLDGQPAKLPPMRTTSRKSPSSAQGVAHHRTSTTTETIGWQPGCECDGELVKREVEKGAPTKVTPGYDFVLHEKIEKPRDPIPCIVMDPFSGSGQTGITALRLGRAYLGIDIGKQYTDMGVKRIDGDAPLFNRTHVSVGRGDR